MENIKLTGTTNRIFEIVAESGISSPSIIAEKIGQSTQNVSKIMKELEIKGLVKCITPEKRTWKEYSLSEQGLKVWGQIKPSFHFQSIEDEDYFVAENLISKIASEKKITQGAIKSLIHFCLENLREKTIETGFIIGDLPQDYILSEINLKKAMVAESKDFIKRSSVVIDGKTFAYHFNKNGLLQNIIRLSPLIGKKSNPLLWKHEQPYAFLTSNKDNIGIFVSSSLGLFNIYSDGDKVITYRSGVFKASSTRKIYNNLLTISESKNVRRSLLERLMKIVFHLSESRIGTIILLGNSKKIMENATTDPSDILQISRINIDSLSDDEILALSKEDGAVVVDEQGYIDKFRVLLRPKKETTVKTSLEGGMRQISASKTSKEAGAIAFVVSDRGPLTVYCDGELIINSN